jgi:hypothetical protein
VRRANDAMMREAWSSWDRNYLKKESGRYAHETSFRFPSKVRYFSKKPRLTFPPDPEKNPAEFGGD